MELLKYQTLVGLPCFAQNFYCQLCLYVSLFLCLSITQYLCLSPVSLYLSPKPNLTLYLYACLLTCPHVPLSHPLPLTIQIRNSLLLRVIFGWTNSFITLYRLKILSCWNVEQLNNWNFQTFESVRRLRLLN